MKRYWLPTLVLTTLLSPLTPKALAFEAESIGQLPLSEPSGLTDSVDGWNDGPQAEWEAQWEAEWEAELALADVDHVAQFIDDYNSSAVRAAVSSDDWHQGQAIDPWAPELAFADVEHVEQFAEEPDAAVAGFEAGFDDWHQGQDIELANELALIEADPLAKGLASPVDDLEPLEGKWAEDLEDADVSLEKGFIRLGSRRNRSRHGRLRRRQGRRGDIFFGNSGRRRGRYGHSRSRRRRLDFNDIFFRHDVFRRSRRRRHDQFRHDDFRNDQFRYDDGRRRLR